MRKPQIGWTLSCLRGIHKMKKTLLFLVVCRLLLAAIRMFGTYIRWCDLQDQLVVVISEQGTKKSIVMTHSNIKSRGGWSHWRDGVVATKYWMYKAPLSCWEVCMLFPRTNSRLTQSPCLANERATKYTRLGRYPPSRALHTNCNICNADTRASHRGHG